jgi:hypothetical protein
MNTKDIFKLMGITMPHKNREFLSEQSFKSWRSCQFTYQRLFSSTFSTWHHDSLDSAFRNINVSEKKRTKMSQFTESRVEKLKHLDPVISVKIEPNVVILS